MFCCKTHSVAWQAAQKGPNKLEADFGKEFPGLEFVGDGERWILGRLGWMNPDFHLPGTNRFIELYGDYWHQNDDPQERIDAFAKAGFETLVIWEHEFRNDFEDVEKRVMEFLARP